MKSGSPTPDDGGWSSAQRPYWDEATNGPGPAGPGRRGDPQEGPGRPREAPFGPAISWPNGFRQLDPESRHLLDSGYALPGYGPEGYGSPGYGPAGIGAEGYGSPGYGPEGYGPQRSGSAGSGSAGYGYPGPRRGAYDRVDPGYGGAPGRGNGHGYQQPAMDDYGYGDPGYSDPAYDGPRAGGSALPGGTRGSRAPGAPASADGGGYGKAPRHRAPGFGESSGPEFGYPQGQPSVGDQEIYPVTGAQEALPGTGPQQAYPPAGAEAIYPVTGAQEALPGTGLQQLYRPGGAAESYRPGDAGEIYPVTGAQEALPATGPQPLAGSWTANDASFPQVGSEPYAQGYDRPGPDDQRASGPRGDGRAASDPRLAGMRYDELHYEDPPFGGSGYDEPLDDDSWYEELRRSEPSYPQSSGGPSGTDQHPADRQRRADPRPSGYGQQPGFPQAPGPERTFGYGQPRENRGGLGPQMSTGRDARPPGPAMPQDLAFSDASYLGAPASGVGVLTPPGTRRLDPPAGGSQFLAPPVRPGHGLDGPEITSSWPAQPQVDDPDSFEDFWREDDDDAYRGLFPDETDTQDSRRKASRGVGRRRGRSRDHRLWLALIGVVVVAAVAIAGILRFEFPSHSGPTHVLVTPARIGSYALTVNLAKQTHLAELRDEVIKMSSGQASDVVSAVYESGNSAAGSMTQIIMFIGGHLANAAPATSIAAFTEKFAGATVVSAGSLGGQAACVENGAGTADPVSMCVWFDNDSFGEIVSPTMNATLLASEMQTIRPSVELVAKK